MRRAFSLVLLVFCLGAVYAQEIRVSGTVIDAQTGETLVGANIVYGPTQGTVTDFEGRFHLMLPPGEYTVNSSYVGYITEIRQVSVSDKPVILEIKMASMAIDEVVITADMAISRRTPVAFTNV
ncbi:MAG: carboxypeptidase-like regulatory domain-containing protein, partial [Bacteroidales bacterium]|nr:carboxypeptidase-like regulatory domain-containing protein [Bacteroidales bacterium]